MSEVATPRNSRREGSVSKVIVVLPIFNEAAALPTLCPALVEELRDLGIPLQIIAVDDGSSDNSLELLGELSATLPLTILRHDTNMGLGRTVRDGLCAAATEADPQDVVVTMDADETHPTSFIGDLLDKLEQGADVAIASRFQPGAKVTGVPASRRLFSRGAGVLMRVAFPTPGVRDYTCGYRAYRAEIIQRTIAAYGEEFVTSDGFQCMVDILLQVRKQGARFAEVPFTLRYDMKQGESKMKVGNTIFATLALIVRRRLNS
jgi:dolichol-phosphate mannosyltransferase